MAKQIDIASFECDCGHQSHFFENTIRETMKKPVGPDSKSRLTPRQGQFLAFIHLYTKLNRRPPAESDIAVGDDET